jgi:hypothetical protein
MDRSRDRIAIAAGRDTEDLVNFIFQQLPDEVVDEVDLKRLSPEEAGVARELLTTAAILTASSTIAVSVVRLIERWVEARRQREAVELIYEAGKENPDVVKVLTELEKHHSNVGATFGRITPAWVKSVGGR